MLASPFSYTPAPADIGQADLGHQGRVRRKILLDAGNQISPGCEHVSQERILRVLDGIAVAHSPGARQRPRRPAVAVRRQTDLTSRAEYPICRRVIGGNTCDCADDDQIAALASRHRRRVSVIVLPSWIKFLDMWVSFTSPCCSQADTSRCSAAADSVLLPARR